jgi:hypothetical protein
MGHTPNLSLPALLLSPFHAYTMGKCDIAQRTLVLIMKTLGMEPRQISDITDIPTVTINTIWNRAIERGFDPRRQPLMITDAYVIDAPRSGRPKKQTSEVSAIALANIRRDRYGREKPCADIAGEISAEMNISISIISIWQILNNQVSKTNSTRKPGLIARMRIERLAWCLTHRHWTLEEDWKNVI